MTPVYAEFKRLVSELTIRFERPVPGWYDIKKIVIKCDQDRAESLFPKQHFPADLQVHPFHDHLERTTAEKLIEEWRDAQFRGPSDR